MPKFINDFLEFLNNKFQGEVPNLLYFVIGITIGIILFLVFLIVFVIIYKAKAKVKDNVKKDEIIIKVEYKEIIDKYVENYNNSYFNASFKDKFIGFGKIVISMMKDISSLYYPNSEDSMFEISIDQLVDFLSYMTHRINYTIDGILESKLAIIEKVTHIDGKNVKLSLAFELIDKGKKIAINNKNKPKKEGFIASIANKIINKGKQVAISIGQNATNDELLNLIPILGEDINKLYSNQELTFTDLSKKERRRLEKNYKKSLRLSLKKGSDVND